MTTFRPLGRGPINLASGTPTNIALVLQLALPDENVEIAAGSKQDGQMTGGQRLALWLAA